MGDAAVLRCLHSTVSIKSSVIQQFLAPEAASCKAAPSKVWTQKMFQKPCRKLFLTGTLAVNGSVHSH